MSPGPPDLPPALSAALGQPWRRRAWWAGILFAAASLAIMLLFSPHYQLYHKLADPHNARLASFPPFGGDFLSEWVGGYIVRAGDHARFYDPVYATQIQHSPEIVGFAWDRRTHLRLFYPPCYYLLVTPLSYLPVWPAAVTWCVLMWACLAGAIVVLSRCEGGPALAPWVLILAMLSNPLSESLNTGQKGSLWLLVLAATFLLLQRGRPGWAGVVFSLMALKPPLAVAIGLALLAKRQWAFVGGAVVGGAVLLLLSLAVGWDVCVQYFKLTTAAADFTLHPNYPLHKEHSWYGFWAALLGPGGAGAIKPAAAAMMLASAGLLALVLRGPLTWTGARGALQAAALVLATLLLSPKIQSYDLSIVLLAVFGLLAAALTAGGVTPAWRWVLATAAGGLFLVTSFSDLVARHVVVQFSPLVLLGTLAVLAAAVRHIGAEGEPARSQPVKST